MFVDSGAHISIHLTDMFKRQSTSAKPSKWLELQRNALRRIARLNDHPQSPRPTPSLLGLLEDSTAQENVPIIPLVAGVAHHNHLVGRPAIVVIRPMSPAVMAPRLANLAVVLGAFKDRRRARLRLMLR